MSVATNISSELHDRIGTLCNILEMQRASLIRSLITRGVDDLENKLAKRVEKMREHQEQLDKI